MMHPTARFPLEKSTANAVPLARHLGRSATPSRWKKGRSGLQDAAIRLIKSNAWSEKPCMVLYGKHYLVARHFLQKP